ncbi:hypothetical protein D9615_005858 [Tricholomella constricta]|uniref:Phosphoglycerate mutase-like protein n=1 Tax=Tricholomella constricta TaxID=117010 RepID=A0A8H5M3D1_9AGAR|nr:hypothetical protein D9615_005858 [Tricholomella constricta]
MITVTFIRHGESEDNTKHIWAGWKDAPLSELGQKQAQAVAKSLATTKFDYVYASPLLRAFATGKAIHESQSHNPPFAVNPKLREQHFGHAESNAWALRIPEGQTADSLMANNIYPVLPTRADRFPEGESLEDLARRAEEAIAECVMPHVGETGVHVAIASHGLCISELIAALLRLDPESRRDVSYTGLLNTAWTRVTVCWKNDRSKDSAVLRVHVTDVNQCEHLASLASHIWNFRVDTSPVAKYNEARAFFGGKLDANIPATTAEI